MARSGRMRLLRHRGLGLGSFRAGRGPRPTDLSAAYQAASGMAQD